MVTGMKFRKYLKHVIYIFIYYFGILYVVVRVQKKIKRKFPAIILFYHRFHQKKKKEVILPSLEISEFRKQLLHLKRYYAFITMDEIAATLREGRDFSAPCIVITIDDGYLDNYELAYPFLVETGISSTIYLATGLIGSNLGLWVDDLEFGLIHGENKSFGFRELFGEGLVKISTNVEKEKALDMLYGAMVGMDNVRRKEAIGKLFDLLKVEKSKLRDRPRVMLNPEEIREMAKDGICFGAHSVSHPCLSATPIDSGKEEIRASKETVERWVKKQVRHFAIPNGKKDDFTEELRDFCKKIGFDTIVTTEPGLVDSRADRFSLGRILPSGPLYYFACEVARYFFWRRDR